MPEQTPLERHKADLEQIIRVCRAEPHRGTAVLFADRVARLAESLLVRLPEESHCANHPADQICPECTS